LAGYKKVKISMESNYLQENVVKWIQYYLTIDSICKEKVRTWEELKYMNEIQHLINAVRGMIVKWVCFNSAVSSYYCMLIHFLCF